jgi:hypothetical protein
MPSGITLKETAAASIPTPSTDKATLFLDSADGLPKYKNDAGTTTSLVGAAGSSGTNGAGYLATSTTSLATAGSGSKVFTTQSGLAYTAGARVRATSAGTAEWMEGVVASYSGTTLTVTMDLNSGTGTHADWNINLAGQRGATGATGAAGGASAGTANGRLTTESGVAVSTSDRTAQSTLYFTPYKGNTVSLYNGSTWAGLAFTEISLALSGLTSGKNYDVFVYDNAGTLTLELSAAWTTDTARADALTTQDGVLVKSGALTRLYVGTIRTTGTTTTEFSFGRTTSQTGGKAFVWNYYNRLPVEISVFDTTDNWSYTTDTWRQANAASGNKVEFVVGVNEESFNALLMAGTYHVNNNTAPARVAIGLDSTTTPGKYIAQVQSNDGNTQDKRNMTVKRAEFSGIGYHYLSWMERGGGGGTCLFFGDDGGACQYGLSVTMSA